MDIKLATDNSLDSQYRLGKNAHNLSQLNLTRTYLRVYRFTIKPKLQTLISQNATSTYFVTWALLWYPPSFDEIPINLTYHTLFNLINQQDYKSIEIPKWKTILISHFFFNEWKFTDIGDGFLYNYEFSFYRLWLVFW